MGDPLKKVQPGQPLRIPAQTFNTFIDTAKDFLQRRQAIGGDPLADVPPAGIVLVRNDSGTDQDRFAVLAITGNVITPADNLDHWKNRVVLTVDTPTAAAAGRFVVLREPIKSGVLGHAWADGICQVLVDVVDTDHEWAEVSDSTAKLTSCFRGSARILTPPDATGDQWLVVRLSPAIQPALYAKITAIKTSLGTAWTADDGYPHGVQANPCDGDGNSVDAGTTLCLTLPPRATRTLTTGQVVAWQPSDGKPNAWNLQDADGHVVWGVDDDHGLPILDDGDPPVVWFWDDDESPNDHYGYDTGWGFVDSAWDGRVPVLYKSGDADFGTFHAQAGSKTHEHDGTTGGPDFVANRAIGTAPSVADGNHTHNYTTSTENHLPPHIVIRAIVWKGLGNT